MDGILKGSRWKFAGDDVGEEIGEGKGERKKSLQWTVDREGGAPEIGKWNGWRMVENSKLEFQVVAGKDLTQGERDEIIALCDLAYEEDMGVIINQLVDPVHVLGYWDEKLVTHALWVTRYLQPEGLPMLRTAYLEAVATNPDFQYRGFASLIMRKVVEEIQDFDIAGLAPFSVDYYARLGWELWRGAMFERKEDGLVASPADEEVMIYRLPKTPALDLDAAISVEWREGEVW